MNRRDFLGTGVALLAANGFMKQASSAQPLQTSSVPLLDRDLSRHRFGVNYTPSHQWWFCWNDWDPAPIQRDLDDIAGIGADHLRIFLIWPYFQPNAIWISSTHLQRLEQLLSWMAERGLDAIVTVFTGQLSGLYFLPPFYRDSAHFYEDATMWEAQSLLIRSLSKTLRSHRNVIGYDFGNEMETCWSADLAVGDAWMARMFSLMKETFPEGLHVNGASFDSWFRKATFSPQALAQYTVPVLHAYPYWSDSLKYGGAFDPPSVRLLAAFAALVRSYAGDANKPVWAAEFNTCLVDLTEKQQALWLEKAAVAGVEEGVSWFTYWDSHDTNHQFRFNPVEYGLGLIANNHRVKDQGRVFQDLVKGYKGKQVAVPKRSVPPPPPQLDDESTWKWLLEFLDWPSSNKSRR